MNQPCLAYRRMPCKGYLCCSLHNYYLRFKLQSKGKIFLRIIGWEKIVVGDINCFIAEAKWATIES